MIGWQGRRVLVTGAAGFIGANLVEALVSAGADVHALVRPSTDGFRLAGLAGRFAMPIADLADAPATRSVLRSVRPEIVFHAAAPTGHYDAPDARSDGLKKTLVLTASLCSAIREAGVARLVHFGSSLEYGAAIEPLSEARALTPTTGRGAAKAAETQMVRQFGAEGRVAVVIVRPFSVYGPWEQASRLVPTVMRAILTGGELRLTRPGIRRDFVFVRDVVRASLLAALSPGASGETINVGSGRQWTNEALVDLAQRVAGVTIRVVPSAFDTRPVDTDHWVADVRKARAVLGWAPAYDLEQGLAETYRWSAAWGLAGSGAAAREASR
jgi:nucleoside-diphosphate-sugar epimerase